MDKANEENPRDSYKITFHKSRGKMGDAIKEYLKNDENQFVPPETSKYSIRSSIPADEKSKSWTISARCQRGVVAPVGNSYLEYLESLEDEQGTEKAVQNLK